MAKTDTAKRFAHNIHTGTETKTVFLTKSEHDNVMKLPHALESGYSLVRYNNNGTKSFLWLLLNSKDATDTQKFVEMDSNKDGYITAEELLLLDSSMNIGTINMTSKILYKSVTIRSRENADITEFKMKVAEASAYYKQMIKGMPAAYRWDDGSIHTSPQKHA